MEAKEFLDIFIKKNKKTPIKIYQCPKCLAKDRTGGDFTHPINFLAHILQTCPDWIEYLDDFNIWSFCKKETVHEMIKEFIKVFQGVVKPVGVKN